MPSHPLDPRTLAQAPELATLAALEKLLSLAVRALVAEHSSLAHPGCFDTRRTEPATLREGRRILRRISPLEDALVRYQRAALDALAPPPVGDDDLPF